jgi:SAM-dependent methyltransferase
MFSIIKKRLKEFRSAEYWETRYRSGGNSGAGSYNHLALFKAEVINTLLKEFNISTVVEFGCGDGNQLSLLSMEKYIGLDVSPTAIQKCIGKFEGDQAKSFYLYNSFCFKDAAELFKMECSMSLDVLFHLVEQKVYDIYLDHLFSSAGKIVIIYAANLDIPLQSTHEYYRMFTKDIEIKYPQWELTRTIKNRYPAKNFEDQEGSLADFFVFKRSSNATIDVPSIR